MSTAKEWGGLNVGALTKTAEIDKLKKASFQLAGEYPFIFDAISYICTHHRGAVKRQDAPNETHYRVETKNMESFFDAAIGEYEQYKDLLLYNIYKLIEKPSAKVLPLSDSYSVKTWPIIITLIYKNGETLTKAEAQRMRNLINKKMGGGIKNKDLEMRPIDGIAIEFYKPLFANLLIGKHEKKDTED